MNNLISVAVSYLQSCSFIEILGSITACISLTGAFLNANRKWYSFLVWMTANISWIIYDIYKEAYSQAGLFSAYLLMNIYGLYCWKFKKNIKESNENTLDSKNSSIKTKSAA